MPPDWLNPVLRPIATQPPNPRRIVGLYCSNGLETGTLSPIGFHALSLHGVNLRASVLDRLALDALRVERASLELTSNYDGPR